MKILSPIEAEAASAPAVEAAVLRINATLILGRREAIVEPGIADAVIAMLQSAGWSVDSRGCDGGSLSRFLTISARPS